MISLTVISKFIGLPVFTLPRSFLFVALGFLGFQMQASTTLSFNRDVRPILSDNCFHCHGTDPENRKAGLRLDQFETATSEKKGRRAIAPGHPGQSELVLRIETTDEDDLMPPPASGRVLSAEQKKILKQWIQEGARYEKHWSFEAPRRPTLPGVVQTDWGKNSIDRFILYKLEQLGLKPNPEEEKGRLLRRVSLDLTGLPPTPHELEDFLRDSSPLAYEKVVDRLLASPHYGERMAVPWLDAARYADTQGYLFDTEQFQWRWRDWLIEAFNQNLPFDRFTIEQLAGDLLPEPTPAQKMASGFNRNHIINTEAGAIAPEYFVENVFDRVETTSTVWMGLTMQCARCHDHKYDPITQKEYFQLYSFFNNVTEQGLGELNKNAPPLMTAPTEEQGRQRGLLDQSIQRAESALKEKESSIALEQRLWEKEFFKPPAEVTAGLWGYWPFDGTVVNSLGDSKLEGGTEAFATALMGQGITLDGKRFINAGNSLAFETNTPLSIAAWIRLDDLAGRHAILSKMEGASKSYKGISFQILDGGLLFSIVQSFPDYQLNLKTKGRMAAKEWNHVAVTYDGSGKVAGLKMYLNGQVQDTESSQETLKESVAVSEPVLIGNGQPGAFLRGQMDEVRVYSRALPADEIKALPGNSLHTLMAVAPEQRNEEQFRRLRQAFLTQFAPDEMKGLYRAVSLSKEKRAALEKNIPTVMVMHEMEKPRDTFILTRGAYDKPGGKVSAATLSVLPPLDEGLPRNRLGLAKWLVDPGHPLTARVTVNRFWQMYFGAGLVRTTENFGFQSEWPSHPELLDWLATEFVRSGWNVKAFQRLIVTSAAYRQSAAATSAALERDPENRFLSRGPRVRLDAEFIRDQALAASGLLSRQIGGPSIRPYEPPELWREVAFDTTGIALTAQLYVQDHGEKLYRRGLYTFWKRTSPPATLQTFDAPNRERCVVRRDRTNTPQQALVTMNDPVYVEASRKLAERMIRDGGKTSADKIRFGFQLLTARFPSPTELDPLLQFFKKQEIRFASHPQSAEAILKVGEAVADPAINPSQLAAFTLIANILLNLDEVLTKG